MSNEKPRVAIVGGGSAGTTAAYRLWKEYGDRADITLYEREEHVGGRAWDITFAGTRIEVGGTILHSSGKHVMELMAFTGSVEGESGLSIDGKDETYGFWTDKGFPVLCHTSLASMAAGIWRSRSTTLSALSVVGLPLMMSVTARPENMMVPFISLTPGMLVSAS